MRPARDAVGRAAKSAQRTEGVDYPFEYRYYKGWGLRQVKYPSGRWVRYTPDAAERTAQVEAVDSGGNVLKSYWSGVQYAPQGGLKQVTLGNTLTERWGYNLTRQQPYEVRLGVAGNEGSHLKLQFAYCANQYSGASCAANNGNILAQWNYANNHIEHYSYDAVNRLTGAVDYAATQGWSQTYGFDRYGNRWLAAPSELPVDPRTPTSQSFINASNNRLTGANYAFDAAGNQTKFGGWTLGYDAENRLVSSQPSGGNVTTYAYDGEGRRVKKTTNGVSTWFVYNAMGELAAEYLASAPSGPAATHYVTTDHLGSTRLVTDASGNVVSRHDYLPFGEEIGAGIGGRTAGMGYVANAGLTQRFTGKERDAETGLDYFGARYLSGVLGRWTSPDWSELPQPVPYADFSDPQTLNLYAYVRNNPMRLTDPDGHGFWTKFGNWFTGGGWNEDEEAERIRQAAAQRRADEARAALSKMHGFTINGKTPAEVAKNPNNQQVMAAYGQAQNFLLGVAQEALAPCGPDIKCGMIPIGPPSAAFGRGIIAQNGTKVTGFTVHGIDRVIGDTAKRAGTRPQAILDALTNPKQITSGVDQQGRPFQIFTGKSARVVVNPETGNIVSVNPLSGAGAH